MYRYLDILDNYDWVTSVNTSDKIPRYFSQLGSLLAEACIVILSQPLETSFPTIDFKNARWYNNWQSVITNNGTFRPLSLPTTQPRPNQSRPHPPQRAPLHPQRKGIQDSPPISHISLTTNCKETNASTTSICRIGADERRL